MLPDSELRRYARHLMLPGAGLEGQQRLKAARVLVVGMGGLGCPAAQYLAAAGVGRLTLVDDDRVELSNLQRQPLYTEVDIGQPKAEVAATRLRALNSAIRVEPLVERVTAANVLELARQHDLVLDGTDSLSARYLLADGCHLVRVPLVHAALRRFEGQVALFPSGGPCYRCLFPRPPPPEVVEDCATAGVLGAVPGLLGSLQALEALKWLLRIGPREARLLLLDGLAGTVQRVALAQRPDCPLCGESPTITVPTEEPLTCRPGELAPEELQAALEGPAPPLLVDLREPWERKLVLIPGEELHLPFKQLAQWQGELPRERELLLYCRTGIQSAMALRQLQQGGREARHLTGGIAAWLRETGQQERLY
ncbi:MAG: molybdopterin-synthase adenylyltransferase MoeB [Candidatus Poseidoniia archaeon]|nr:molybdopterin-synthase adenylyltransferase MoeB [Candidatus Poseidoniia archaeon]MDP6846782.1 molybdopterin-synthase adenylyltransferase MoeB [Candidatus Poseidoniia archaeon]MDP7006602.1 molybdopterin-synthase adenylyltransferase MoeB [Candidatus Poseidoniia archaeon]